MLQTLAKGFAMGAADVVPGVSGGTMAFILGIYQRLLEAIRAFDLRLLRLLARADLAGAARHTDLLFLVPLVLGIAAALFFFTRVVPLPVLLQTHPEIIYGLFFGLILASIAVLFTEITHLGAKGWLALVAGTAFGLTIVNLVPMETPDDAWFIFLAGAVAICAMILPGISGSFILLLLRKYSYVFDAIGHFNLAVLIPFALGAATGLMLFSRFLVWLLHHYYRVTLLTINGILVGSLWMIWPFQDRHFEVVREKTRLVSSTPVWPTEWNATVAAALAMMLAGMALVALLHGLGKRKAVR